MSCVLTLALDDTAQERFESLRQRWFPPERNLIPAHLTMFHTLPESAETNLVLRAVAQQHASFAMRVSEVRSLGRGVAFFLESKEAPALHRQLSEAFLDDLSAQDKQGFRPHVVIQNKVEPAVAKQTLAVIQAGFTPWECHAVGLDLWRYLNGPWKWMERFPFAGEAKAAAMSG